MIGTRINIVVAEIPQQLLTECYNNNNNNSRKFYFGPDERRNVVRRTKARRPLNKICARLDNENWLALSLEKFVKKKQKIKDYCVCV
jgi:hypothetical protein